MLGRDRAAVHLSLGGEVGLRSNPGEGALPQRRLSHGSGSGLDESDRDLMVGTEACENAARTGDWDEAA